MIKEFVRKFLRATGRITLYCVRGAIRHLPYPIYKVCAWIFFIFGQAVMFHKRLTAKQSLLIALGPERSSQEIKAITKKYFYNFGSGMIDLIYFIDHPYLIDQNVTIEGKEYLDNALKQGKGVILTGGHFGNFILMYLKMVQAGYKTNVIMRRVRDNIFERYITNFRIKHGIQTIYDLPTRQCVQESIRALRRNEVLIILLDQNYGQSGGVFVDFFGQKAATATGPAVFSLRTKAPILPVFSMRAEGKMQHKIIVEPEITLASGANEEEIIYNTVQKITKVIESYVKKYPHEWGGWVHKRWKTRPVQEQLIIDRLKNLNKPKIA